MDTQFPNFGLLPAELRLKIWRYSLSRRTVPVRLQFDLDGPNNWTDADWWRHYRVTFDGPPPQLPAATRVNREARYELMKFYKKPLQINKEAVRKIDERPVAGFDSFDDCFDRLCDNVDIPHINDEYDILEWHDPSVRRRNYNGYNGSVYHPPLFLRLVCLSIRHVSIDCSLLGQRSRPEELSLACLDRSIPLQTVTVFSRNLTWRLVRRPDKPIRLWTDVGADHRDVESFRTILDHESACFFPWYRRRKDDCKKLREVWKPAGYDLHTNNVGPHPFSSLDMDYCILQVLGPTLLEDDLYIRALLSCPPLLSSYFMSVSSGSKRSFYTFGQNLLVDVLQWSDTLHWSDALTYVPDATSDSNFTKGVRCHGFCLPDYGLP